MSRYDDISTRETSTVRWVRKRVEPTTSFWPAALWPLLGLLALSVFSCANIQERTEAVTERELTDANLEWAEANASGRYVYLTGDAPSRGEADRAMRIAKNVEAGTWLGSKLVPAPRRVYENFKFPELPPAGTDATPSEPSVIEPQPATPPNPRPAAPQADLPSPNWNFQLTNGVLELNGQVPTDQIRQDINQLAQASVSPPRFTAVQDNLVVINTTPPSGYLDVAKRGVRVVVQCDQGVSAFANKRFALRCQLPSNKIQQVRADASAPLPYGTLGQISTQSVEAVSACETSMRTLLSNARIEFQSASSVIEPASAPLVQDIAAAAKSCPGSLRIEGHTDSTGNDADNQTLSQARAEALRAALVEQGVAATRLIAQGYGPKRPIADNSTREGRARNRRIEIKVVRPND